MSYSDGVDAAVMVTVDDIGVLSSIGVIGQDTTAVDNLINLSIVLPISDGNKLDSACDKFYFRRIS